MSWSLHPRAGYFLQHGGALRPPPAYCRVELAGEAGRYMDFGRFEQVAATLFPMVYEVELAGAGEPLLHPRFADVLAVLARHGCNWALATRGTLFSERIIRLLARQHGCVTLALDAAGPDFDAVRQLAQWHEAEPQVRRFLAARYPHRLRVRLRPVLTQRTVRDAPDIVQWAAEQKLEEVEFRSYVPVEGALEAAPGVEDLARVRESLQARLAHERLLQVRLDGALLNRFPVPDRRSEFANVYKRAVALSGDGERVAVGIDGGAAVSVETFAAAWCPS